MFRIVTLGRENMEYNCISTVFSPYFFGLLPDDTGSLKP
jgi:hypothetical protein